MSGRAKAGDWLEARGVKQAAFRAFVRAQDPKNMEDFDADTIWEVDDGCGTLTVGDKKEDALVCSLAVRTSLMRYSAVVVVVRNKRPVSVLDLGYALPAMDWPDARWLDLQLAFSNGGLEADLHDRAKAGSVLVRAPSDCRKHFARYLACEKGASRWNGIVRRVPARDGIIRPDLHRSHVADAAGLPDGWRPRRAERLCGGDPGARRGRQRGRRGCFVRSRGRAPTARSW